MKDENLESTTYVTTERSRKLNGAGIFFLITTLAFLGAGIFLFADSNHKAKEMKTMNTELVASENRYADLDSKYTAVLGEIESYKGKNADLDSMLTIREKSIKDLRTNLNKEKKKRTLSEAEYKGQLENLNSMIVELNTKIEELQKTNSMLVVRTDSMRSDISQKQTMISELETNNSTLSQKVTVASLLIPSEIEVTGVRDKSNGKESETSRASKTQHLKVCFNIPENKVSGAGEKTFLVRILSPQGSVLAIQNQGSGTFTSVETKEQMQYSTTASVDYANQAKAGVCSMWSQSTPFAVGKYTAEIYQDGYLIGKQNFELK
jgi:peptidoglycan hydrolase CwlO-like protein